MTTIPGGRRGIAVVLRRIVALLAVAVAVGGFIWPAGVVMRAMVDPGIPGRGVPHCAWGLHRSLTPRIERWALGRVGSGVATQLDKENISGTEWPLFGSVFYLWATEDLQVAWESSGRRGPEPRIYARSAIDATTRLVADPQHAHWVRLHWGDEYLRREDVFYRMLLISALTAHERLIGSGEFRQTLRDQVDGLSTELDASPRGLLDDYPGQCFPVDVGFALRAIRRADQVLGTAHAPFIARERRAYPPDALPPYFTNKTAPTAQDAPRGCSTSPLLFVGAELWPDTADRWYPLYERDFWQARWWGAGFREFPRGYRGADEYANVDSGPIIAGFGCAATAFGVAAARAHGREAQARALTLEAIAASWPLPGGSLLIPRFLSDRTDAPLLGEAGVLAAITQPALRPVVTTPSIGVPGSVWIALVVWLACAWALIRRAVRWVR